MSMRWILLTLIPTLHAGTLYYTDFESFTVGPNNWGSATGTSTDGWLSNDTTNGAQSIEVDLDPNIALGNSATIGIGPVDPDDPVQPAGSSVSVFRFFNYDHTATGLPNLEINCLVAIQDSTNGDYDNFYITIYNANGTPLAALLFDNAGPAGSGPTFGIWREDGRFKWDTGSDFSQGQFFQLYLEIDLSANTWSADLGPEFQIFTDEPFTAVVGADINFGVLAFEWALTESDPADWGDNFLVIDELTVRSVPVGIDPFTTTGTRDSVTGDLTLSWHGNNGFDYQVQFSTDLEDWHDTLPGSTFPNVTTDGPMSYTDTTSDNDDIYYRVVRSESP